MTDSFPLPQSSDAILGGQAPPTGAVLGGLAGIKQRLANSAGNHQATLADALNYGQPGLNLLMQILLEAEFLNSEQLQQAAYDVLRDRPEPNVQSALRAYNPYPYFACLNTHLYSGDAVMGLFGTEPFVRSVVLSPDGQTLVGRSGATIQAFSMKTGHILATFALPIGTDDVSAAIGEWYPHLKVWSIRNGEIDRQAGYEDSHLAFFPDGQTVASGGNNGTVRLWNRHTGTLIGTLHETRSVVNAVAVSPDGQTLVDGTYSPVITIWHVPTKQIVMKLNAHKGPIWDVAITPDGQTLVSASGDSTIRVWDLPTGQERYTLRGHQDSVSTIAISADRRILVSGSADKTVKVWNLQTGRKLQTLTGHTHSILSVTISSNKQWIVSGSRDGTIKIWGMPSTV